MTTILFLHGWQSVPGGVKPTHLKDHGHSVLNPKLPDDDFEEAVRIAQAEFDKHQPQIVVGSSRGGAVAMNINSGSAKLVLLCPAWKKYSKATTVKADTVILHSRADDVVPFADSEELVRNSGLPPYTLIEVGTDHRLADPEPLEMMLRAVDEFEMVYPNCHTILRTVEVGHLSKSELLQEFERHSIKMNEYGNRLFADALFARSESPRILKTFELQARNLGFHQGAIWADILRAAMERGLALCPIDAGPYLRLQYLDQPEGFWITVASQKLFDRDDYPNGFYLRRLADGLWLRGYRAAPEHLWKADEHFIFAMDELTVAL